MAFFTVEKLNARLTCIRSKTQELLYLIEGNDSALLVDTSVGVRGLRALVESLTDKPYQVVLTHGHVDHAPGAVEFPEVYLNPDDTALYQAHCQLDIRQGYLESLLPPAEAQAAIAQLLPPAPDFPFKPLGDGQVFDLGGLHVQCFHVPGHTKGSMMLLIPELETLITGDDCNKSTFLFDEEAEFVDQYRQTLVSIEKKLHGQYRQVLITHHDLEVDPNIINNVISVCDDVLADKDDKMPFEFMGQHVFVAKTADAHFNRLDGGVGNIVYAKNRVHSD